MNKFATGSPFYNAVSQSEPKKKKCSFSTSISRNLPRRGQGHSRWDWIGRWEGVKGGKENLIRVVKGAARDGVMVPLHKDTCSSYGLEDLPTGRKMVKRNGHLVFRGTRGFVSLQATLLLCSRTNRRGYTVIHVSFFFLYQVM